MQAFMAVSVALGLVLAGAGSVRAQGYLLYDDFNSGKINQDRWMGNDQGEFNPADGGAAVPAVGPTDTRREVVNGTLRMQMTGFGRTDSGSSQLFLRNNLTFAESHSVTA